MGRSSLESSCAMAITLVLLSPPPFPGAVAKWLAGTTVPRNFCEDSMCIEFEVAAPLCELDENGNGAMPLHSAFEICTLYFESVSDPLSPCFFAIGREPFLPGSLESKMCGPLTIGDL